MILTQKIYFLFLICCIIAKNSDYSRNNWFRKIIYNKILSEILEQDLSIYLLNSNYGLSLFNEQSVMKEEFDIKKKEKLKKILKIKVKNVEDINSEDFSQFLVKINKKLKSDKLKESEKMEYENAKNTLLILSSPLNRYMHQDWEWIINIKTILYIIKHVFYLFYNNKKN